jgi:hypothetical protein
MRISISIQLKVKSLTSMKVSVGGDSLPERSISGLLTYGTGESFLFFMAKFPWASCKANRLYFHVSEESSSFVALDQLHDHTQPKLAEVIVSFVFGVLWAR